MIHNQQQYKDPMYKVTEYFLQIDKGLDKKIVEGGPVFSIQNSKERIGVILKYFPNNGFVQVCLNEAVSYTDLMQSGIPLSHIIFQNKA